MAKRECICDQFVEWDKESVRKHILEVHSEHDDFDHRHAGTCESCEIAADFVREFGEEVVKDA